jgi:hypothetical protein
LKWELHRRSIASNCSKFFLLMSATRAIDLIAETPPTKEKTSCFDRRST